MRAVIGAYQNSGYALNVGARQLVVYGITPFNAGNIEKFFIQDGDGLTSSTPAIPLMVNGYIKAQITNYQPTNTTTGVVASGGSLTAGIYSYKITFVYGSGLETIPSAATANITTDSSNKTVNLSNIPLGISGCISRKIYRTLVGGSVYYYVGTISDNTTTTYTDTLADATADDNPLVPTTTQVYSVIYNTSLRVLASTDIPYIWVDIQDPSVNYTTNTGYVTISNAVSPTSTSQVDTEYTNVAAGTVYSDILSTVGYNNHIITCGGTMGTNNQVIITLEAKLKASAVTTDSNFWIDVTTLLTGSASYTITTGTTASYIWLIKDTPLEYIRIKQVWTNSGTASNSFYYSVINSN